MHRLTGLYVATMQNLAWWQENGKPHQPGNNAELGMVAGEQQATSARQVMMAQVVLPPRQTNQVVMSPKQMEVAPKACT